MLPDRVSNPGPLTYESGALPIALRGPARAIEVLLYFLTYSIKNLMKITTNTRGIPDVENKYLSWVYGVDRNMCHEGH